MQMHCASRGVRIASLRSSLRAAPGDPIGPEINDSAAGARDPRATRRLETLKSEGYTATVTLSHRPPPIAVTTAWRSLREQELAPMLFADHVFAPNTSFVSVRAGLAQVKNASAAQAFSTYAASPQPRTIPSQRVVRSGSGA